MEIVMSLGEYISRRRKYLRLTQDQLAELLNVSKSAVAKWETDGGIPDRGNLKKLAEVLGIGISDLYRIIDSNVVDESEIEVNITADILAVLRSHGYTVIPPKAVINEEDK